MPNTKYAKLSKSDKGVKITEHLESDTSTFVDSTPEDGIMGERSEHPTSMPAASAMPTTSSTYADALKAKGSGFKAKADDPGKTSVSGVKVDISRPGDKLKSKAPDKDTPRPRSHSITPSELSPNHMVSGNTDGGVKLPTQPANSAPPGLDLQVKAGPFSDATDEVAGARVDPSDLSMSPHTLPPPSIFLPQGSNDLFSTPLGSEYDAMGSDGFKSQLPSLNPSFHNSPTLSPENGSPTRRNGAFPGRLRHNTAVGTGLGLAGSEGAITRDDRTDEGLAFYSSPPAYPDGHILGAEKQRRNALVPGEAAGLDEHWLDEVKQKLGGTSTTDVQFSSSRDASGASYAQRKSSETGDTNGTSGSHVDKGKGKANIDAWIGTTTTHSDDGGIGGDKVTFGREEHECLEKGTSCIHCFPVAIVGREKMSPYPGNSSHQSVYAGNANTNNRGNRVGSYGRVGGNTYGEFDEHGIYHPHNSQYTLCDQFNNRKIFIENFAEQFQEGGKRCEPGVHREFNEQYTHPYGHYKTGENGLRGGAASFTASSNQRAVSDPASTTDFSQGSTQYDGGGPNASAPLPSAEFGKQYAPHIQQGGNQDEMRRSSVAGPSSIRQFEAHQQVQYGRQQLNQHGTTADDYRTLNESLITSQNLDPHHAALSRERAEMDIQNYIRGISSMQGRPGVQTIVHQTQSQGQSGDFDDSGDERPYSRGSLGQLPSTKPPLSSRDYRGSRNGNVPSLGVIGAPKGTTSAPDVTKGGLSVAEFEAERGSRLQKYNVPGMQPPSNQQPGSISAPGTHKVFGLKQYTTLEDHQRLRAETEFVTSQDLGGTRYGNGPSRDLRYGVAKELRGIYDHIYGSNTAYAAAYPNSAYGSQPNSALAHFAHPDRSRAAPGGLSIEEQDRRDAERRAALAAVDPQRYAQAYGGNGMTDAAGGRIIGHETSEGPVEYGGTLAYGRQGPAPGQQRRGGGPGNPYEQNVVSYGARPNQWVRVSGATTTGSGGKMYGQAPPEFSSQFGGHNDSVNDVTAGISHIQSNQPLPSTHQYQRTQQGRNISDSTDVSHFSTSSGNHPSSQTSGQAGDGPIDIENLTSPGSKPLPVSEIFKERTQALVHGSTLRPFSPARFIEPYEPGSGGNGVVRPPSAAGQLGLGGIGSFNGNQYGGSQYGGYGGGGGMMVAGPGPYSHMLHSQSLSHYSRASTPSSIGDGQSHHHSGLSHHQGLLGMHPSFGGGLEGLTYRGVRQTTHTLHSSIPDNLNTCLWVECLPPDITYAELLAAIRGCGRIFSTHINYPSASHSTSAAKVAFFRRESAENLMRLGLEGKFAVRGFRSLVRWNRNRYSESASDKGESRVLLVRGHKRYVNEATLSEYFNKLFWYNLVSVEAPSMEDARVHGLLDDPEEVAIWSANPEPGHAGELESEEQGGSGSSRVTTYTCAGNAEDPQSGGPKKLRIGVMVWEFGSFHAQAQAAKQAIEREPKFIGRVRVDYLRDPCE